jgi:hypothetical protein
MPESLGSRGIRLAMTESLGDCVAIVRHKDYRDRVLSGDSFLDCLPRDGRILPRRILMQVAVACASLP